MTMTANGLAKLNEEIGELLQETGKKLAYFQSVAHPDGAGPLNERVQREMADLYAAMDFVAITHRLNQSVIETRRRAKLALYKSSPSLKMKAGGIAILQRNMGTLLVISSSKLEDFDESVVCVQAPEDDALTMAIADVHAALDYVQAHFQLDGEQIGQRRASKVALFKMWHADSTNGTDSFHYEWSKVTPGLTVSS